MRPSFLLCVALLSLTLPLKAQTLELGGKVGASTMASQPPQTEAGVFAAVKGQAWRLGLRVELNYQNRSQFPSQTQVPILATVPLGQQQLVELHAGPYMSHSPVAERPPILQFGFSTGLQINFPLSRRLVLVSKGQADQLLTGNGAQSESPQAQWAPAKNLSLRLSLGLVYRLRRLRPRHHRPKGK